MARPEAKTKREYGRFKVEQERRRNGHGRFKSKTDWRVRDRDGNVFWTGTNRIGRQRAQALASALDSAEVLWMERVLPFDDKPDKYKSNEPWEKWAADQLVVPIRIASSGNAVIAGFLYAVYELDADTISRKLGVSEQTAHQYLTDLRADRR